MNINAHTDLYCIFGNPVRHSLSPVIHNTAFRKMGINAVYCAFTPASISSGFDAIRTLGIRGASITIPYKTEAPRYVDELDEMANLVGSVNTVLNSGGKLVGYNTDGYGAIRSLLDSGIQVRDRNFLLVGNGGSARAIAYSLLTEGADVLIAGRNERNVSGLTDELKSRYEKVGGTMLSGLTAGVMEKIDVVINSTPLGMLPDTEAIPLDPDLLREKHAVFDIVYAPHNTRLLREAGKRGCVIVHGIDMLVNQGAKQFEIWTGVPAPVDDIMKALKKATVHSR